MKREYIYLVRYPIPGSALFEVSDSIAVTRSYYQRLKRRFPGSTEFRRYVVGCIEHELQVSTEWLSTRRNKKSFCRIS